MTRSLPFHLLDVFTDRPFGGNPLAVVEAADRLGAAEMLRIAREFNHSETVFLQEPSDPVNSARIRIFTPECELPFAGHPSVGAAAVIAQTRADEMLAKAGLAVVLETQIGPARCDLRYGTAGSTYAEVLLPRLPESGPAAPPAQAIAAALALAPADIGFDGHSPTIHSAGPAFLFVPLRSRAALESARRVAPAFAAVLVEARAAGAYLYTRETVTPDAAVNARMFAHGLGFDEDPATGSAAAAFAAVAAAFERPEEGEHELLVEQGYPMGRPSLITLRMWIDGGALVRVAVGGQVVRLGEGRLRL